MDAFLLVLYLLFVTDKVEEEDESVGIINRVLGLADVVEFHILVLFGLVKQLRTGRKKLVTVG